LSSCTDTFIPKSGGGIGSPHCAFKAASGSGVGVGAGVGPETGVGDGVGLVVEPEPQANKKSDAAAASDHAFRDLETIIICTLTLGLSGRTQRPPSIRHRGCRSQLVD
jgi:hypothetical protein